MTQDVIDATSGETGHYLYVLACADGTLYTGYTIDVEQRVATHNEGKGAKYTRARLPVKLVAQAEFTTKNKAMSAEYRFKRLPRQQKLQLIADAEDQPFEMVLADFFR